MEFDNRSARLVTCALVLVGSVIALGAQQARANGMRCDSKLVDRGDTTYEVKALCGPPDEARQRVDRRSVRRIVAVPAERVTARWSSKT